MNELIQNYKNPILSTRGLHLFVNSSCNLNCPFCYLNKTPSYQIVDKEIQDAWKDKTYIQNILKVLKKLDVSPGNIDNIRLWGGETYIAIENIEENIDDIMNYFPNVKDWLMSTNFTQDMTKIVSFIKKVDERTKYGTAFRFQISIDGPEGIWREKGHNVSDRFYKSQFEKLAKFINNYNFKNITRFIIFNKSTLGHEVYYDTFTNLEKFRDYMTFFDNFMEYLKSIFFNKVVEINMGFPSIANPYNASTEDGMKFAQVIRNWDYLKMTYFRNSKNKSFLGNFYFSQGVLGKNRYIDGPTGGCDMYNVSLAIMHDGSIVPCSGAFIQYRKEYINDLREQVKNGEKDITYLKHALLENRTAIFNPLTATDLEIKKYFWYVVQGWSQLNLLGTHLKLGALEELALSGQAPWIYYGNIEERMKAAQIIGLNCNCQRINIETTGISQLADLGDIRLYANGAVEEIERDFELYDNSILRYAKSKNIKDE